MAAYLNSKRLIQGHALFLFILAVYLTKSPEVITDSDVVYFTLRDTIKIVRLILLLVHFQIMNLSLLALGGMTAVQLTDVGENAGYPPPHAPTISIRLLRCSPGG
jgi:hypothetical protein